MTAGISRRAVDFRRVFAGEGTSAMRTATSVGVNDYLATCETGVGMRASENELSGGIHMQNQIIVKKIPDCGRQLGLDTRKKNVFHIIINLFEHLFVCHGTSLGGVFKRLDKVVMLGGNYNCVYSHRSVVFIIFNSYLTLGIRTEICGELTFAVIIHGVTLATDVCQFAKQKMRQVKCQRHVVFSLVYSIAEHHALVTGALKVFGIHVLATAAYSAVDILALLVNGTENSACISVKTVCATVVTYLIDQTANRVLYVYVSLRANLSGNNHLSGSAKRFDCDMTFRITRKKFIKQSITYLVSHLIGMTFGNGFRCK